MPRNAPELKPLDLLFMLADACMHRLSPTAWKVVSYVAAQHLRAHPEWLHLHRDPASYYHDRDLQGAGMINSPGESEGRSHRPVPEATSIPGERGPARFVVISLKELCQGVRIKRRYRDHGTGLAKSSVAEAIKEAVQTGVLVHERQKNSSGRDLPSQYAINWDKVQEYDWMRRKGLKG